MAKKPPAGRAAIESQIEEFLRRALQGGAPQPAAPEEVVEADVVEVLPPERLAQPKGKSLSEHVAQAMDTTDVTGRLRHLGESVSQADDRMDAEVHRKFDRKAGIISDAYEDAESNRLARADVPPPLIALLERLRQPGGIAQAVLLNEILKRPEHDW